MRKAIENIDKILDCSPYALNDSASILRTKDGLDYSIIVERLRFRFLCKYDGSIWFGWNDSTSNNVVLKQFSKDKISELFNHIEFIINSVRDL